MVFLPARRAGCVDACRVGFAFFAFVTLVVSVLRALPFLVLALVPFLVLAFVPFLELLVVY
ncbi:hypothetical protein SAMN05192563_100758 [Paraburkholderia aspalathi]|jgi:hypothetical protein|uniref:Uncharacterized protein n=1 Tax=Paraburkholderia aspalathi TaxID=1324617 RepID=A0A1I7CN37_9BURK|nr:hypothetical protein SAMN05192563_100758 [Paraburkholderia aspalathi]